MICKIDYFNRCLTYKILSKMHHTLLLIVFRLCPHCKDGIRQRDWRLCLSVIILVNVPSVNHSICLETHHLSLYFSNNLTLIIIVMIIVNIFHVIWNRALLLLLHPLLLPAFWFICHQHRVLFISLKASCLWSLS